MTPEEFNALCAELEDARLDMRTVEPQSKYTCYEEWYADHIADLDDADKVDHLAAAKEALRDAEQHGQGFDAQIAQTNALISIADSLNSIRISLEELAGR